MYETRCKARPGTKTSVAGRLLTEGDYAGALSEARFDQSVKLGEVLCARSIEPFEGGRWRLRWMRADGWSRSDGYGN
jgi:hypothetical protein